MKQFCLLIFSAAIISVVNGQNIDERVNKWLFDTNGNRYRLKENAFVSKQTCPGKCVPYYSCEGKTIIDFRDEICENSLEVCCQFHDIVEKLVTRLDVHSRQGCGHRNPDGVGFKITGNSDNESEYGEFPWMVGITYLEKAASDSTEELKVYKCGGALIHPSVVLTAAHCVEKLETEKIIIRAGEWDVFTNTELFPHQDRRVSEVRVHPYYFETGQYNSLALLFLEEPVVLSENVDVVCLPDKQEVFDDSSCFLSGWGKNVFGKQGKYQAILKKINLEVISVANCQESLRKTRLGPTFDLHYTFMCAGGANGRDTCKGDGGSPMVCPTKEDPTRYKQVGIASWGIDCGISNTPGVFVDVAKYREWIDEEMFYKELDTSFYKA